MDRHSKCSGTVSGILKSKASAAQLLLLYRWRPISIVSQSPFSGLAPNAVNSCVTQKDKGYFCCVEYVYLLFWKLVFLFWVFIRFDALFSFKNSGVESETSSPRSPRACITIVSVCKVTLCHMKFSSSSSSSSSSRIATFFDSRRL